MNNFPDRLLGLGTLLVGVGAPKLIEGLPHWVNIALFAVGAVLMLAAFIAHLISGKKGGGGDSGIKQPSHGSNSPVINAAAGSIVNLQFDIRRDSRMPDNDEEIIRRVLERQGRLGHQVTSHNQTGGITAGEVHVHAEDKSLKRQLRNLLAAADSRILFEIDRGILDIETRMTGAQFTRLNEIAQTEGSANIISKADVTGRFVDCAINNGTFGPSTAEHEQIRVSFRFTNELREAEGSMKA